MREIAEEAGVNKALLHYYFRSKSKLAEAVFRRAAQRLLPPVLEILRSEAPIDEKVRGVVEVELSQLARNPYLPGYILSELAHHPERAPQLVETMAGMPVESFAPQVRETLGRQLEEAARRGDLRPISPEDFVVNLIALCIFPFAARPMLGVVLGLEGTRFRDFIEARKDSLPAFFLRALEP